ncbi:DNA-dependent RNA polymerase II [Marasmius sp. AFHP31]|nr:DNA-dependent RNA polymerase II [Marasmius sp. AFHP31]
MPTGYDEEDEDGYGKIAREDSWTVFSSLFEQKGPVRRQLDSFDEFVQNTMQELVDENSDLTLDQAEQFSGQQTDSISSRTMKSSLDRSTSRGRPSQREMGLQDEDLYDLNECLYHSGGYFIISGSEKVLIAQERMATNHIYVFAKAQPSRIDSLAEIRSVVEKGGKTINQFQVKMLHRNQE